MSLLIRALKQAEQRHQRAAAEAIEQSAAFVASEEPLQRAAQPAGSNAKADIDIPTFAGLHGDAPALGTLAIEPTVPEAPPEIEVPFPVLELEVPAEVVTLSEDPPVAVPTLDSRSGAASLQLSEPPQPVTEPVPRQIARRAESSGPGDVPRRRSAPPQDAPPRGQDSADAPPSPHASPSERPAGTVRAGWVLPRAGQAKARKRLLVWGAMVLAVAATGGWLAWQILVPPSGLPTVSAAPPPFAPATRPDIAPATTPDTTPAEPSKVDAPAEAPQAAAAAKDEGNAPSVPNKPAKPTAPGPSRSSSVAGVERPERAPSGKPDTMPAAAPLAGQPEARPPGAASSGSRRPAAAPQDQRSPAVTLVRTDDSERAVKLLEAAYQALQLGNVEVARSKYEQVLALDPNNTDALVGLATCSVRTGNPLQAERLFKQVLAVDPNDQAAKAGLVALRSAGDPANQESQLRQVLAEDDTQPAVHYALGNVLAAQGRWADAQQAYFSATAGDPDQPDYAFNLAVSLERIKQPRAAALYYRRALELAAVRPARFPADRARARLEALEPAGDRARGN